VVSINDLIDPPAVIYPSIAIEKVDEALNQAKRNNEDELRIIVGECRDERVDISCKKTRLRKALVVFRFGS
jgi:hypothetical protein